MLRRYLPFCCCCITGSRKSCCGRLFENLESFGTKIKLRRSIVCQLCVGRKQIYKQRRKKKKIDEFHMLITSQHVSLSCQFTLPKQSIQGMLGVFLELIQAKKLMV